MNKLKLLLCLVVAIATLTTVSVFAEAPVEEAGLDYQQPAPAPVTDSNAEVNSNDNPVTTTSHFSNNEGQTVNEAEQPAPLNTANMSLEDRVRRLEQQGNNIANMNMPQQIADLQQQIAQLRGQLGVQEHDIQLLNKQLAGFYKELDDRLRQAGNSANSNSQSINPASDSTSSAPTHAQLQDANAYQAAFTLLSGRQYHESEKAFLNYLNDNPNGKYVADAHYWLGEIFLLNKNTKKAEAEFQTVVGKYPNSAKIPDAKLKVAIIHANAGQVAQAKTELLEIKKKNPNSTAAQLANIRLQQLEQSGSL